MVNICGMDFIKYNILSKIYKIKSNNRDFVLPSDIKYPIGMISNANAKRNLKKIINLNYIQKIFGNPENCIIRETISLEELRRTITHFEAKGVSVIMSSGGDGTHNKLATLLVEEFPNYKPYIVPLKSGTMNMLPKNLNLDIFPYSTARWLKLVMDGKTTPKIGSKNLLKVEVSSLEKPYYGFVFVAGCGYKMLNLYYSYPKRGKRSAAKAILSPLTKWLSNLPQDVLAYTPSKFYLNEQEHEFPYLLTVASSLEKLVLGFSPFALRNADEKDFYVMIDGEHMIKNYNILKFYKIIDNEEWKPKRIVTRTSYMKFDVTDGFSVDGEIFEIPQESTAVISIGPEIKMLSPLPII
jgi:hypothetical protein